MSRRPTPLAVALLAAVALPAPPRAAGAQFPHSVAVLSGEAPPRARRPAPLIDRAPLVADPEVADAQLDPTGRLVAFRAPYRGSPNVWVTGVDEPFTHARGSRAASPAVPSPSHRALPTSGAGSCR